MRALRRIFYIFLALIMLGLLGYFYLSKFFLPFKANEIVIEQLESALNRPVTLENINYIPLKGIVLTNLQVFQDTSEEETLLDTEEISLTLLWPALLWEQRIIIPNITVKNPNLTIGLDKEGRWNFSDILNNETDSDNAFKDKLFIKKITFQQGTLNFSDLRDNQPFNETIQNINASANLLITKKIKLSLSATIPELQSQLNLQGQYDIDRKSFRAEIDAQDIELSRYKKYLNTTEQLRIESGSISSTRVVFNREPEELTIQGSLNTTNIALSLNKDQKLSGNFSISGFDARKTEDNLNLSGQLFSTNSSWTTKDAESFEGSFNASIDHAELSQGSVRASGSFFSEKIIFKQGEQLYFDGGIKLTDYRFRQLNDSLNLEGSLNVNAEKLTSVSGDQKITATGEFDIPDFEFISNEDKSFSFRSSPSVKNLNLSLDESGNISGGLIFERFKSTYDSDGELILEADGKANNISADINTYTFKGDPGFELNFEGAVNNLAKAKYSGELLLNNAMLSSETLTTDLKNLSGRLKIKDRTITLDDMAVSVFNINPTLSGQIQLGLNSQADINASIKELNVKELSTLSPKKIEILDQLSGLITNIKLNYDGSIKNFNANNLSLEAMVKDLSYSGDNELSSITGVNGPIRYDDSSLKFSNLSATWNEQPLALDGTLFISESNILSANISAPDIDIAVRTGLEPNAFKIEQLQGKYHNSTFNVKGWLDLEDKNSPKIEMAGQTNLNIKDLEHINDRSWKVIHSIKPSGQLAMNGSVSGPLKDFSSLVVDFTAQSDRIMVGKANIYDVNLDYKQADGSIAPFELSANLYEGQISFQGQANLKSSKRILDGILQLSNIDMELLRKELALKNKHLSGKLNLNSRFNIPLESANQVSGRGSISITEGFLWQKNLLEGLTSALLIPEYQNLILTDLTADFEVYDEAVRTSNAIIKGNNVNLLCSGWIGFDKSISFDISPQFSETVLATSDSLRKGPSALITQVVSVNLSGTLDKPIFKNETSIPKVLERSGDILKDSIGTILEGVLEGL